MLYKTCANLGEGRFGVALDAVGYVVIAVGGWNFGQLTVVGKKRGLGDFLIFGQNSPTLVAHFPCSAQTVHIHTV